MLVGTLGERVRVGRRVRGGRRGVQSLTIAMHGRSLSDFIAPRIPTMLERSTSCFLRPGGMLLAPSIKRETLFGESEGWTASNEEPLVRRTSASCSCFLAYGR